MLFNEQERPRTPMGYTEGEVHQRFLEFEANLPAEWASLEEDAFFVRTMLSRAVGSNVHFDLEIDGAKSVRAWCKSFGVSGEQRFVTDSDTFEFFDVDMRNGEVWGKRKDAHRRQRYGFVRRLDYQMMRRVGAHQFDILFDVVVDSLIAAKRPLEHLNFSRIGSVLESYRHYRQSSVAKYAISRSFLEFSRLSELAKEFKGRNLDVNVLMVSDLKLLMGFNKMAHFDDEMSNRLQRDTFDFGRSCYEIQIQLVSGESYVTQVYGWSEAVRYVDKWDNARLRRYGDDESVSRTVLFYRVVYSKDGLEYERVNLLVSDIKKVTMRHLVEG